VFEPNPLGRYIPTNIGSSYYIYSCEEIVYEICYNIVMHTISSKLYITYMYIFVIFILYINCESAINHKNSR